MIRDQQDMFHPINPRDLNTMNDGAWVNFSGAEDGMYRRIPWKQRLRSPNE